MSYVRPNAVNNTLRLRETLPFVTNCASVRWSIIVSYLVDECRDFIGEEGEGGGETYYSYSRQTTKINSHSASFFRL